MTGAVASAAGPRRRDNQDAGRWLPAAAAEGGLLVVADGMGGHEGGRLASEAAVEAVARRWESGGGSPDERLREALGAANAAIRELVRREPALAGMGTTCTALAVADGGIYCAHVGDSRAYLVREGAIYCMTEDHSATMEMVRRGLMTRSQARTHADRHVILRALGPREAVEIYGWPKPFPARAGDRWVVCSDGLYDAISEPEMATLAAVHPPAAACRELVGLAVARECADNVTVGVLAL